VTQGEPFSQVFPNGIIPQRAWGNPAQHLLHYIPSPNVGTNLFSSGAEKRTINDNKASGRVDFNSNRYGALLDLLLL
jgi:hypothetical protein